MNARLTRTSLPHALVLAVLLAPVALGAQSAPAAKTASTRQKLTWGPAPPVFSRGARMAVVSGDPSKAEMFEVRLSFPNGYRVAPHFHPTDETVRVRSGVLLVGMGDTLDVGKTQRMTAGDSGTIAANMHHFAVARGRTVISVRAMGPFQLTYVNPADDPQKKRQAMR